jgi:hypothetical protein
MATEAEKLAFLQERVGYDLAMLNYTFMRVVTARPSTMEKQLDRNAFLESFAVHARNLVRFLCPKAKASVRNASDYVADFEAPNQSRLARPLLKLEQQILNITTERTTDPQERFSVDDARELYTWIVPAVLKFEEKLTPEYRVNLNALGSVRQSSRAHKARTSGS